MTNILSIDSSKRFYEISIGKNEQDIVNIISSDANKHSENLIIEIESLLKSSNTEYDDLDVIAVNVGPGSFTSIRAGIAISIGINLVKKTKLIAVTSFESIAYQAIEQRKLDNNGDILVVIDARREQLFVQMVDLNLNCVKEPKLIYYDEISDYIENNSISIICGNGVNLISDKINSENVEIYQDFQSNSESILKIAKVKFNNDLTSDTLTPLYIRKPDAKKQGML